MRMTRFLSIFLVANLLSFQNTSACFLTLKNLIRGNFSSERIISIYKFGNTHFEFSASGKSDRIVNYDYANGKEARILYEGTIKRIPMKKSIFNRKLKVPGNVEHRVQSYEYIINYDDQRAEYSFAIGVLGGTLIIYFVHGFYPEAGNFLNYKPVSTFFVPEEYKQVTGASIKFLPELKTISGIPTNVAVYVVIAVEEGLAGNINYIDWINELAYFEDVKPEDAFEPNQSWIDTTQPSHKTEYYIDYRTKPAKYHSWLIRLSRPIMWPHHSAKECRSLSPFDSENLIMFRGPAKKIADADYSNFKQWWIANNTLHLDPGYDPEYIQLTNPSWRKPISIELDRAKK